MIRNDSLPSPEASRVMDLQAEFPGATRWGILGSAGGSWRRPDDFVCTACGCSKQLIIWYGHGQEMTPTRQGCFSCWYVQHEQLTLPLVED